MNKNDILEKSRASKKDEGKEYVKSLTYRYAYIPILVVTGFLLGVNYIFPEDLPVFLTGLGAIVSTVAAAEFFAKYRFGGKKGHVAVTVIAAIVAVALCGLYAVLVAGS